MAANVVELNTFTSSSPAHAVVRLIDPAAHDCAEMRPAIKSNNTLTHQTAADKLIECL